MDLESRLILYSSLLKERGFTEEANLVEKMAHYEPANTKGVPSFWRKNYDYGEDFYYGDMSKKPGVKEWLEKHKDKGPNFPLKKKKKLGSLLNKTASPRFETLKKHKQPLDEQEKNRAMDAGAVWHHGSNNEETSAIWKAEVDGKTWYICNTHRAFQAKPTLEEAIKSYKFIETTAGVS